ncbi:hypothetical protein CC86DRAFT_379964 [Ophiobolus disseminans]|uniref:Uncharacterized protein n=1 Tax=Ophiobolus disseminans TaxID=1469910 RepID=A0A6A7A7S4_9PLEO|nr:hypothetical protein CC86DRAFT_379964 [Ophiobolus disseminans]
MNGTRIWLESGYRCTFCQAFELACRDIHRHVTTTTLARAPAPVKQAANVSKKFGEAKVKSQLSNLSGQASSSPARIMESRAAEMHKTQDSRPTMLVQAMKALSRRAEDAEHTNIMLEKQHADEIARLMLEHAKKLVHLQQK